MKKIHIFIALATLLSLSAIANPVDVKTAKKVAETFMQIQTDKRITLQTIDYADREAFPNFYVFGTENSFVIISADDCVQPVLGYSTENPFGTEKMPENLFCWLKGYDEQIAYVAKSGQKATSDIADEWKALISGNTSKAKSEVIAGPLIQTKWSQNSPYNNLCPGGNATGCVATAMAQIMKYWSTVYDDEIYANPSGFWNYLTKGFGSHSFTPAAHSEYGEQSVDFGNATYDWRNMTNTYSNSSTDAEKEAVAKLMYHCGVSVNMDYGGNGSMSGASTEYVAYALQTYFNYKQTAQYITRESIVDEIGQEDLEQWKDMLKAELTANPPRPIQYRGSGSGGHSFVCDGYNSDDKFHFNWGWGNNADGYYPITGLTPPNNNNFNEGQAAIFGIQPITYDAQPSGLEASVANQNVTLTWTLVDNASSYNVYRNYNLIGNTESNINTFTDSDVPIGEYEYFVRSVDSQGNVSLPSNIQNATVGFDCSLENLSIEHLQLSYQDGNATLQWEAPYRQQYLDYFNFEGNRYYWGPGEPTDFYWGTRFRASVFPSNIKLTSVSTFFQTEGEYTTIIYQCTDGVPSSEPIATVTNNYKKGWNTIGISPAINIDNQKDLWIVFKTTDITWTLIVGDQNADEGNYYSNNGTGWRHLTGYSYFVSANLSNDSFTYTLYDNGQSIAENLNVPVYTHPNISSNTAHQYTVKTKLNEEETVPSNMVGITVGTASLTSLELGENDMMTVTENSSLIVTGALINDNPDNLIIEDGGQLTTSSENVQATMQKNIEAATSWGDVNNDANGWYFIASPVTSDLVSADVDGLITTGEGNDYDFYFLDEENQKWGNYKQHDNNLNPEFATEHQKGYLYASENGTTIQFTGAIAPCTPDATVTLTKQGTGWNLVGNPFTFNATVNKSYYAMKEDHTGINPILASGVVPPCAGILIQADSDGETITFSKPTSQGQTMNSGNLQIALTDANLRGNAILDNAIVSFNECDQLEKFYFMENKANVYIPQNGKEYSIASYENQDEMPLNFNASKNGTYTLTIEAENIGLAYLHLIDNLTGSDIDLLTTPSYTFEAKTTDYASRFRLAFSENDGPSTGSETANFAFVSNSEIIINGATDNATLQIVDMTGHVIVSHGGHTRCVPTSGMVAGVYVLRLIDGDNIKTQKIVIE